MLTLNDGYNVYGTGETEEAAINDALEHCYDPHVTRSWIDKMLDKGQTFCGLSTGEYLQFTDDCGVDDIAQSYFDEFGVNEIRNNVGELIYPVDDEWLGTAYSETYSGGLEYYEFAKAIKNRYKILCES